MSITDELRKWAGGSSISSWTMEHLTAIADRIDAEHESACAEAYGNGVMSVPIALDESAWVELPKDADGEYIHVGDVMEMDDEPFEVRRIELDESGEWTMRDRMGVGHLYAHLYRHYHAPTVEDVLRELLDEAEHFHSLEEEREAIAEYAAKLRLAGDAE